MTYVIKSKPGCPYCDKAKALIEQTGEQMIEQVYATHLEIANFKGEGFKTFPQIFHKGQYIGGHDELVRYLAEHDTF